MARNVNSALAADEITAIADDVDAEIDGLLGTVFWWPFNENGDDLRTDPPAQIVAIANFITAGLLEQQRFAQTEAGGPMANPYGKSLERQGRNMLQRIIEFRMDVPGLSAIIQVQQTQATQSFFPVSGFGRSRFSGFSRHRGGC